MTRRVLREDRKTYRYEIAPGRWVSRQRVWQIKMKAEGRCIWCGVTTKDGLRCEEHAERYRWTVNAGARRRRERVKASARATTSTT